MPSSLHESFTFMLLSFPFLQVTILLCKSRRSFFDCNSRIHAARSACSTPVAPRRSLHAESLLSSPSLQLHSPRPSLQSVQCSAPVAPFSPLLLCNSTPLAPICSAPLTPRRSLHAAPLVPLCSETPRPSLQSAPLRSLHVAPLAPSRSARSTLLRSFHSALLRSLHTARSTLLRSAHSTGLASLSRSLAPLHSLHSSRQRQFSLIAFARRSPRHTTTPSIQFALLLNCTTGYLRRRRCCCRAFGTDSHFGSIWLYNFCKTYTLDSRQAVTASMACSDEEFLHNNHIEDVTWLCSLSESELDFLISLKMLMQRRAKVIGHEHLAEKFDLKMLRALGLILMDYLKEKVKHLEGFPGMAGSASHFDASNLLKLNLEDVMTVEDIKACIGTILNDQQWLGYSILKMPHDEVAPNQKKQRRGT